MHVSFFIQDPTDASTTYLYEAIVAAVEGSIRWRGMYAFASQNGVDNLLGDAAMMTFLHEGGVAEVVVGMDAITNRITLERLQHFEGKYPTFKPKVFWNAHKGLFHPKLSLFDYADGSQTLIVGSGNLTPGGLRTNFEGYTVVQTEPGEEAIDLASLEAFMVRHTGSIRAIDDAALLEAAKNVIKVSKRPPTAPPPIVVPAPIALPMAIASGRILVAQVPAAGARWQQLHLNAVVIEEFFRVTEIKNQRIFLTPVRADGTREEEQVRQVVFSNTNKNYKIEISQGRGLGYPATPPVIVFLETQLRTFDYMLLMPGQPGYADLTALSKSEPAIGKGMPRVIIDSLALQAAWPTAPLLTGAGAVESL